MQENCWLGAKLLSPIDFAEKLSIIRGREVCSIEALTSKYQATACAQLAHSGAETKIFRESALSVRRRNRRMDAAAHVEVAHHRHFARPARRDEVVENPIDHRLMKRAFIAIGPKIKFQSFEFDAALIRHVGDFDGGEIGLAGFRADAGKFRTLHVDFIVALRPRIGKSVDLFARASGHRVILAQAWVIAIRAAFLTRFGADDNC